MKTALKTSITLITTLSLLACGGISRFATDPTDPTDPPTPKEPRVLEKPKLTQVNSCEDFLESVRKAELEKISRQLSYYSSCPKYSASSDGVLAGDSTTSAGSTSSQSPSASGVAESSPDFTDTNVQESTVAESDIIKTNGKYIFVATSEGVDIFKAWPLADFGKVGQFEVEGGVSHLLLSGTTLIAVSNQQQSKISLIDITKTESPELMWEENLPGSILSSRLIQDVLHVATRTDLGLSHFTDVDFESLYIEAWSGSCQDKNLAEISNMILEDAKKQIENLTEQDVLPQAVACEEILTDGAEFSSSNSMNLMGLTSLNINDPSHFKQSFVQGSASDVYASENSVYLFGNSYDEEAQTNIHRFALGENILHDYKTSTAVDGSFINSFSFSEHEGALRVATQNGSIWGGNSSSQVIVLDTTQEGLPELGRVDGLGQGEKLYGVRFFANRGYVVTYKKVDPLYVLDLSDPKNPKVEGELKMPGYSTYLHWLDDNHIIGLGKDAEEVEGENFSWFQGLKLASFDVSQAEHPLIADELIIGGRGTTSQALDDHHAFTFDSNSGTLALPLTFFETSKGGNNYGKKLYNGVHVYQIDATEGIAEEAIVALPKSATAPKRTILIGDGGEKGLFVLDNMNLYLFEATKGYEFVDSEELDHEIYWNGWCL